MKKIVVLYHAQCWDGFGGAWTARKKFGNLASYIPAEHHNPIPRGLKGKELYLIDFCYPKNIMLDLIKKNKRVVVLDHHITRKAETQMVKEHVFDNFHSGSVIAWKYFFPNKPIPRLLLCVQDNDLWKFKIHKSKETMLAVNLHPYSFEIWDKINRDLENPEKRRRYEIQGDAIFKYIKMLADELCQLADKVSLNGVTALAVNGPRFIRSDLGNALTKRGVNVGIVWYSVGNEVRVSLRSNGKVDVSKVAEKYGGGGHKRAAAFDFKSGIEKRFPWKYLE